VSLAKTSPLISSRSRVQDKKVDPAMKAFYLNKAPSLQEFPDGCQNLNGTADKFVAF
jgi:hypothetical protein